MKQTRIALDPPGTKSWLLAGMLVLGLLATSCGPAAQADHSTTKSASQRHTVVVFSFSVEAEVLQEKILPDFQQHWWEQTGQEVIFKSHFGNAEEISQAILDGEPADVAILPNEQHAIWLRINNLVKTDWQSFPNKGVVTQSPIVIAVRPDNPLGISDWADLARPGVSLVHADPLTSAGAQWALLAEYGSVLLNGPGGEQAALEQMRGIWANVVSTPASSRLALKEFLFGTGDALVTYEQDALLAQARGAALEVVLPPSTILSEHLAVTVDQNIALLESEVVKAFVNYLWSEPAQKSFAQHFFRPTLEIEAAGEFQPVEHLFTVQDLGGWGQAYPKIIQDIWQGQILDR
jgi:sulfate/thiosulfate transport system substrate-binding protein